MDNLTGGIVAFIAGGVLATATVIGVVQTQQNAGETPVSATMDYGTNN